MKSIGGKISNLFKSISEDDFQKIEEIRIRVNRPLIIVYKSLEFFISIKGEMTENSKQAYLPSAIDITSAMELFSGYSLYAFEDELSNGFITIEGGHRIGITGKTIVENGSVKTIKNISGLNIRISHEVVGCADRIIKYICKGNEVNHTLIISPPGCGKTTLLRDIIRQLSDNCGQTVGVVDERSEIAGCYMGVVQNDVGIRTDVLDRCPKATGMLMLIRSMSPDVIAVDEIGKNEDIYAMEDIINSGVRLLCTVHGRGIEDIKIKPVLKTLIEKNIFQRFIVLSCKHGVGSIEGVYDSDFNNVLLD